MKITHDDAATIVCPESLTGETKKAEVCEDVGPLSHAFKSRGPGNGKNGPWIPVSYLNLNYFHEPDFPIVCFYTHWIQFEITFCLIRSKL